MADEALTTDEGCCESEESCCNGAAIAQKVKDATEKATAAVKEKAHQAQVKVKEGVEKSEECIKLHPWAAIGVAASVGVVAGVLIGALAARRG